MNKLNDVSEAKYADVVFSKTNELIASVDLTNGNIIEKNNCSVFVSDTEPEYIEEDGKVYLRQPED